MNVKNTDSEAHSIKAIDASSVHRITSGQVVVDLQTAVKELVENALDAGATNIEVRFKDHGLTSVEVIDNGSGIAPSDYDSVALKHHTSKLSSFSDLTTVLTFGFRGEALSSLCAMCSKVTITTATSDSAPVGTILELGRDGRVTSSSGRVARQRGTTVTIHSLFSPLPVRRKELERHAKREYQRATALLSAYALVPCSEPDQPVRLTVSLNDKGKKSIALRTTASSGVRAAASALWGPKSMDPMVDLDISFDVPLDKHALKRLQTLKGDSDDVADDHTIKIEVKGLISKFALGCGRGGTDRQFFFVNGRPCHLVKAQKVFNEVYRAFNVNQTPVLVANFIIPTGSVDVNVSPDKRTLFLHAEENLLEELRRALEDRFAPSRSTFDVGGKQVQGTSQLLTQSTLPFITATPFPAPLSTQAPTQVASTQPAVEDEGMVVATPLPTPMVTQLSSTNESARDRQEDAEEDDAEGEENILTSATQQSTPGIETLGRLSSQSLSSLSSPRTSPPPSSLRPQRRMIPTTPSYSSPRTPSSTIICRNRGRSGVKAPGSSSPSRFILHKSFSSPATSSPVSRSRTMTSSSRSSDIITPLFLPDEEDELEDDDEEPDDADMVVPTEHSSEEMMSTQNAAWAHTVSPTTPEDDPEISTSRRRGFVTSENVDDEETVTGYKRSLPPSSRVLPPVLASAKRIHRSPSPQNTPDVKRARTSSSSSSQFPSTRKELRSRLASFVAPGSQARVRVDSSDADDTSSPDVSEPDVTSDGIIRANASSSSPSARALFLNRRPDMRNESRSRPVSSSSPIDLTMDGDVLDLDEPPMSRPFAEDDAVDTQVPLVELNQESSDAFELDLDRLAQRWAASRMIPSSTIASCNPFHTHAPAQGASIVSSPEAASSTLSRIISKSDFEHMTILGQFNLGFILTRLRDDLWIVDQHAADEKYNFEDLQRNTQIRSQRLVRPMKLELSRMDEEVAREHEDVLRQNGFELEWDEEDLEMDKSEGDDHDDGYEEDRGEDENKEDVGGQRSLRLVALPMSKNTVFGMQDLEEIIQLLQDQGKSKQGGGEVVRCKKARAMFASRACRKSVMVGMPLQQSRMTAIVTHMGSMDQPWNCPHGRPTMRHLFDVSQVGKRNSRASGIDWSAVEPESAT